MKRTTTINLGGIVFNIDEDAYQTLSNYLSYSTEKKYDYIIGNPPWGYDYTEDEKVSLRKRFKSAIGSSIESFDVFVEQALLNLHQVCILFPLNQ